MANKTDKSSPFRNVASLMGILLVAAAAIFYGQASGNGSGAGVAAVSQGLPLAAIAAVDGEDGAFDRLQAGRSQLQSLRENSAGLPGADADWQRLEQGASAILDRRAGIEEFTAASDALDEHSEALLDGAESLLAASGSTAVIQEFQKRAMNLDPALRSLVVSGDRQGVADAIRADLDYMRQVIDGLGGAASRLDVTALGSAEREATLVPLTGVFADVEQRVGQGLQSIDALDGVDADLDAMRLAASALYDASGPSGSGSILPGFLSSPMIPLGMLGLAAVLLGVLLLLHRKSSVFERTAREQAAQNERNQQAILRLLDELGSLADGDLTVEATVTEDITGAIADSINYAIEKLRELVATINQTSIMVDSAAKQTESTAVHMARAAENQSSEIAAATESIVSMAGSIEEVSGNAERSSDVARHSVEVAHKGGEAVRRTIDGMNTIRETIQDTSKRIKRLGESSQEIGNIVELINDIAEQTNILALNASIQASMAGEAGRGFAVVADEVQRLAERSTNATKQIEVLVRTIQSDTNEAVVSMERSTTDVVGGALLAENAGAALDEIEQVSNQIANLVQNISSSARQQAGSAADVTRRTSKLKEIGEQTGKATTATAAAISKLSVLASQLRATVAGFTLPKAALKANTLAAAQPPAAPQAAPSPPQPAVLEGKAAG
jgi:twitching motility protein PilJ